MRRLRKYYLIYLIIITIITFYPKLKSPTPLEHVKLYFVDRQMMRLIPVDYYIKKGTPEEEAEAVLEALIKGADDNEKIRRMLPNEKNAATVSVSDRVATVDINMTYYDMYEQGKYQEELTVFQIVNSLSSIEGISRVKFVFSGKPEKHFIGNMDMREAFIPDYFV